MNKVVIRENQRLQYDEDIILNNDNKLQIFEQLELQEIDIDNEIIKEMNNDMKQIENDLNNLLDSVRIMNELIYKDEVKLVIAEENLQIADKEILQGNVELEVSVDKFKQNIILKTAIGTVVGGLLIGTPCGVAFGIIGGACGVLGGSTLGGLGGYFSKYLI
jgi:hypothetical protein